MTITVLCAFWHKINCICNKHFTGCIDSTILSSILHRGRDKGCLTTSKAIKTNFLVMIQLHTVVELEFHIGPGFSNSPTVSVPALIALWLAQPRLTFDLNSAIIQGLTILNAPSWCPSFFPHYGATFWYWMGNRRTSNLMSPVFQKVHYLLAGQSTST